MSVHVHLSNRTPWHNYELNAGLMRQAELQAASVLPVRLDDSPLPEPLRSTKSFDLFSDYEASLAELRSVLLDEDSSQLATFEIAETRPGGTIIEIANSVSRALIEHFAAHPEDLRTVNRRTFEEIVAELFNGFGYAVELTKRTRDGGRDVIAVKQKEVGVKYLIECKRPDPEHYVGVEPVRALFGVKNDEQATKAILATTTRFSRDAMLLFERHRWELEPRDYDGLLEWIRLYIEARRQRPTS